MSAAAVKALCHSLLDLSRISFGSDTEKHTRDAGGQGALPARVNAMQQENAMKISEVMHSGVTWVDPSTPISEIAKMMRDQDIGAVPVGENDRLIGMVTDRDICCRGTIDGGKVKQLTARDVMSKPIVYCKADDDVMEAVHVMETRKVRRLPVINEKKRMVGILSLGDVWQNSTGPLSAQVIHAASVIAEKSGAP
jgi:CBS domain-containing protein